MSETVLEQIAKLALGDDRLTEEEQAVIEAAKACVQELRTMEPRPVRDRYLSYQVDSWDRLAAAVDALATQATEEP